MAEPDKSLDVLGIKPVGEAINTVVKGTVDGASAFLSRICLPAAEEFGLLLRDKVSQWRTRNLIRLAEKAEKKLNANKAEDVHGHPRLVSAILEHGSWTENDEVQEMWAGLLASSCTKDGDDDSNLIFINLLSQLSTLQVKVLNYTCRKAEKRVTKHGLIYSEELRIRAQELIEVTEINDLQRLDRELDHLKSLDLIKGGFQLEYNVAGARYADPATGGLPTGAIKPLALGLSLFVRAQGTLTSPAEFFGLAAGASE